MTDDRAERAPGTMSVLLMAAFPNILSEPGRPPDPDVAAVLMRGIEHEVGMLKAALLYADDVTMASIRVGELVTMGAALSAAQRHDEDSFRQCLDQLHRHWHSGSERGSRPRPDPSGDDETPSLEEARRAVVAGLEHHIDRTVADEPSWRDLLRAAEQDLVKVVPLVGQRPVDFLANVWLVLDKGPWTGPGWLPMLDEASWLAVAAGTSAGRPTPRAAQGASQLALARHVIETIPAYPRASMDVLLDVRARLQVPLVRFRAAIAEFARDLDVTPTDPGFDRVSEALYREKVAPELTALQEIGQEQKVWPALRREAAESKGGRVVAATAGLAFSAVAGLPEVVQALSGAAALGTDIAGGIVRTMRESREAQRRSGIYWLYRAHHLLESSER